ncbi:MAG: hypothetical protein MUO43_16220 [Desulfobacterales bacterium]|nr:hypothetical protein [Desulfobacterales bacterium]
MKKNIYKLGEYKIIESNISDLRWEAHFGFGAFQEGRCFRKGRILFIGPAENEGLGYFKKEFFDHLKPFPAWLKTKYYCRGLEVYHCRTGKRVTKEEMLLWMLDRGVEEGDRLYSEKPGQRSNNIYTGKATGDVAFRLQRYEIIKKINGQLVWKTHIGPNTVSGCTCIILEDILFIGTRQNKQFNLNKRQFFANLHRLPKWDQTKYFCPKLSLHVCKTGNRLQEERKKRPIECKATEKHDIGKGYKNSTEFKLKRSDLSESRAMFFARRVMKCINYAAGFILPIISFSFGYLIRCWKGLKGRWHSQKGKSSSIHHSDD